MVSMHGLVSVGLRGCTADVVILEEAAFVDEELFNVVIVPLLGVNHTAILGISTPSDETNYYSELIGTLDENGDPLFKVLAVGLICQACKDDMNPNCTHRIYRMPAWKSVERQEKVMSLLKDQSETAMREAQGVIVSSKKFVFNKVWVDRLKRAPFCALPPVVNVVYIGVDPSGGGTASDYTIASVVFAGNKKVVSVGVCSHSHRLLVRW